MIALMPMKAHSERVPNKNIRPFLGRPLYNFVLEELLESLYIKRIVINTDSEAIKADILGLKNEKIRIIDRPKEICGDFVGMNDIIKYDLSVTNSDYYLQTHATNPLLTSDLIDKAIEVYFKKISDYDSLFSVTKIQSRLYDKNGYPINHDLGELKRTQDLEPIYEENSNLYVFSKKSFYMSENNRIGKNPQIFIMDKKNAIDIDEEEDFQLAEILYKYKKSI